MIYHPFSDELAAAMMQPHVDMFVAVEAFVPSGVVRVHTGVGMIVVNGQLYTGVGTLGQIGAVREDGSTSPHEFTLSLSLLEAGMVALALNEIVVGSKTNVYVGAYKNGVVTASNVLASGEITASSATAGDENVWTLTVADELAAWDRICADRWTDESHSARRMLDRFFRFAGQMAERAISWGSKHDAPPFIYK